MMREIFWFQMDDEQGTSQRHKVSIKIDTKISMV